MATKPPLPRFQSLVMIITNRAAKDHCEIGFVAFGRNNLSLVTLPTKKSDGEIGPVSPVSFMGGKHGLCIEDINILYRPFTPK